MSVTDNHVTTHQSPAASGSLDEEQVIAAARQNPAAFAPLYERHSMPIYRYCYRQVRDPDTASDLTAQIFIQALEKLATYQPREGASFRSWLFTISRNVVRDRWRRHRPVRTFDDVHDAIVEKGPGPEEIAVHRTEMARLLDALESLPERQRDIIEMRLEGLTMREIADVLGTTENAVKTAQTRAFRQLRVVMGEEGRR